MFNYKSFIVAIGLLLLTGTVTIAGAEQLPRLVDVGADKCIPCIKMAPILDALKEDLSGRMEVTFIDAWKNKDEAATYGVRMIPTQIFFGANGQELFRHVGFIGREAILAKWQELGYEFGPDKK